MSADKAITEAELLAIIRDRCKVRGSQTVLAAECGVSAQFITDIVKGRRAISPKVAVAFGYRPVTAALVWEKGDGENGERK